MSDNISASTLAQQLASTLTSILPTKPLSELMIAIVGSVDAGKSTLAGVLSKGELDNGKGKARLFTVPLKHEIESGKTSNVNVITVEVHGRKILLIDLAGHEKYIKTTLKGLNQYFPDYAILLVNAHKGILPMTREHMGICKSLGIPVFIVITKVDNCPPEVLKNTLRKTKRFFKSYGRRFVSELNTPKVIQKYTELLAQNAGVLGGYVQLSNVTGVGLDVLRTVLAKLPELPSVSRAITAYIKTKNIKQLFYVMTPFKVPGTGLVVYGRNYGGELTKGSKMYIGPLDGKFVEIRVRSIHNKMRQPIDVLGHEQLGCLAIKPTNAKAVLTKEMLKQGQLVTEHAQMDTFVARAFRGQLFVHATPTTIREGYKPFLNCGNVRTTATLIHSDMLPLRMGNRANVVFTLRMPSVLYPEMPFIFRDGRVKASGTVLQTLNDEDTKTLLEAVKKEKEKVEEGVD